MTYVWRSTEEARVDGYVCLVLDKDSNIMSAAVVHSTLADAVETAGRFTKAANGWGYEVWHNNHQVKSYHRTLDEAARRPPPPHTARHMPD
jgi:hypothetical protein